jgi:hypothetical protein
MNIEKHYQEKYEEFLRNITNLMYTFEVTKCCGYSTFVSIYKNQTLANLHSNIIQHFGNIEIKQLYFITPQNERINIPISMQTISNFVINNIIGNPCRLVPIYDISKPIVYKLYLYDGHCEPNNCSMIHYHF